MPRCHSLIFCRDDETRSLVDHVADLCSMIYNMIYQSPALNVSAEDHVVGLSSALGQMNMPRDAEDLIAQNLSGYFRSVTYTEEPILESAASLLAITGELSP